MSILVGIAALETVASIGGTQILASSHLVGIPRANAFALPAQLPEAFEVASIKPAAMPSRDGEGGSRSAIECSADGLMMRNIDLDEIIQWAYDLDGSRVLGAGVLHGKRYDIRARAGGTVSVSMLRQLTQELLISRFRVRTHPEQRFMSVYDLVVARGGARLGGSKAEATAQMPAKENLPEVIDGSFVFRNISISEFARQLSELRGIEYPVIDRTGIGGTYDITLKSAAREVLESDGAGLPNLLKEQLGLRLVPAKERFDVLVIDHAENPSPD